MEQEKIVLLLQKYVEDNITTDEKILLEEWAKLHPDNRKLLSQVKTESWLLAELENYNRLAPKDIDAESLMLSRKINKSTPKNSKSLWRRYASIAAALLVTFSIGMYLYFYSRDTSTNTDSRKVNILQNPVFPGANRATLTTDAGETVLLSETHSGLIVGDTLIYEDGTAISTSKTSFATLSTPRGGQYAVTLPDGTKVWLNASSSLRYPTQFTGAERRVSVTGEAFFEVTHNTHQPFIVDTDLQTLQVLGTVFNINAYADERQTATTLVEGKIAIRKKATGHNPVILRPGQQSLMDERAVKIVPVDVQEEIAWKDGKFVFYNSAIQAVMRQLARWYDVEIVYVDDVSAISFTGSLSRSAPLTDILEDIALTESVNLKLEGRRIMVRRR